MATTKQLIDQLGVEIDPHLDRQATVAVAQGLQRQGDVIVIPAHVAHHSAKATTPVAREGAAVVRGESGGNTHLLLADGSVFYDPAPRALTLGVLTVPADSIAYLAHPEHGYAGIGPGTYVLRRQREQADEIRLVAD